MKKKYIMCVFFFSSRRRHTRWTGDWSSDVCSSDLDGVGLVIDRLRTEVPDTPLLVAEFGIGTDDDEMRARYIARGLEVIHAAIERGADVRGCFHWTGVDNYEWLHGFDLAFGIIDRDRNVKPSALVLRGEAR